MKKLSCAIQLEKYPDGSMAVVLSKPFSAKFDKVFGDKRVNVFVGLMEKDKKMTIEITLPKHDYIA